MVLAVDIEQSRLDAICRARGVRRLELFGSATREDFDAKASDLDFLVEFEKGQEASAFDNYFGLKEDLESFFARPIDLVMIGAIRNPYVLEDIERDRTLLYAA